MGSGHSYLQNQPLIFSNGMTTFTGPIGDDAIIHGNAPTSIGLQNQVLLFGNAPTFYRGPVSDSSTIIAAAPLQVESLQNMYTKCAEFIPPTGYAGHVGFQAPYLQQLYVKECGIYNPESPQAIQRYLATPRLRASPLPPVPVPVEDAIAVVGGLIDGLVQADDFQYIKVCLNDASTAQPIIQNIVNDILNGDLSHILDAVANLGKLMEALPRDLADCEGVQPDLARIEQWAQIFKNPTALAQVIFSNVLTHGPKIFADVSQASVDVGANNFYAVGKDVADLTIQVLGPVPKTFTPKHVPTYRYLQNQVMPAEGTFFVPY